MDKFILYLIGIFFVMGGIDYILGSPFKIGVKFEEGIKTMGALGIGMIGIYSLSPVISKILAAKIVPICKVLNLDYSIFTSTFFAIDMGGYQMARELSLNGEMALFSGIIVSSSIGATISFTIPVALGMIDKEDIKYFSKGVMIGIITIPIGCFLGGLSQGIRYNILLWNLTPILVFAIIISIGLFLVPNTLIKLFGVFGKIIISLSIIGLLLQGIDVIFGVKIVQGLAPLSESTVIVSKIAFVLAGAYPMLDIINKIFKGSFNNIGKKFGINSVSVSALIGNLASNLLVFGTYGEMNPKGKVICTSFAVSGAFVFGGQLGFVSGVAPNMIGSFIISKISAGIISIILAENICNWEEKKTVLFTGN